MPGQKTMFGDEAETQPTGAPASVPMHTMFGDAAEDNSPPISLTPGTPNSDATDRFVSGFANAVNPFPGIAAIAGDPEGIRHGIEQNVFEPQRQQFVKAGEAVQGRGQFSKMNPLQRASSAFGHGLAGALPLIGPSAANAGDQIGEGDVAGGLGSAAGLMSTAAIPPLMRGAGRGISRGAEPVAESALGIRNIDRKFGRNPGRAALDETSGVRPETVVSQAQDRLDDLTSQRDAALAGSPNKVSLTPARTIIENAINKAAAGNSDTSHLIPLREQLNTPRLGFAGATSPGPPITISDLQNPMNALAIRQRLGNDFTKFDMARPVSRESQSVGNKAYGNLTDAIHTAVPASAPLDRRISNLIPVKEAAAAKDLAPPTQGQILGRLGAKTGSLAAGTMAGAHYGSPVAGAVLGAVIPELLSDPTAQMIAARALDRTGKIVRSPLGGRAAQLAPNIRSNEPQP